jgi:CRP-like cAMP-binding protein
VSNRTGNRLLDGLPREEFAKLLPHLEEVSLPVREGLLAPNKPIELVHFMTKGIASVVAPLEDGAMVELAVIGNEGMTAIAVILGAVSSPHECFVQVAGSALRMDARTLVEEVNRSPGIREPLLRFAQAVSVHTAQTAACNARHTLEERLARWLLLARDRLQTDQLPLTQEFLSMMLAVRRSGVTVAAGTLQRAGIVRYRHGRITVLDVEALEAAACECYRLVREETARLLETGSRT